MEAIILGIINALTGAVPGAIQLVTEYQAINGPSAVLQAALAALQGANDAAFAATDAKLAAADHG